MLNTTFASSYSSGNVMNSYKQGNDVEIAIESLKSEV